MGRPRRRCPSHAAQYTPAFATSIAPRLEAYLRHIRRCREYFEAAWQDFARHAAMLHWRCGFIDYHTVDAVSCCRRPMLLIDAPALAADIVIYDMLMLYASRDDAPPTSPRVPAHASINKVAAYLRRHKPLPRG